MWLARNFPGLHLRPSDVNELTPEETRALVRAGRKLLDAEAEERFMHTKIVARAAGARI